MQRQRPWPGKLRLQHPVRVDVVRRHQGQLPDASADDVPANSLVLAVAVAISLADTSADDGRAVAVAISLADAGADDGRAVAVAISLADAGADNGRAVAVAISLADAGADDGIAIAVAISLADAGADDGSAYPSANNSPADARADAPTDAYVPSVWREAPLTGPIAKFRSWAGRRLLRNEPELGICSRQR